MTEKKLRDFENRCITCLKGDVIDINGEKKVQCDLGGSYGNLNGGCKNNYIKDLSAFNIDRIYELLGNDFTLEEDFK